MFVLFLNPNSRITDCILETSSNRAYTGMLALETDSHQLREQLTKQQQSKSENKLIQKKCSYCGVYLSFVK